MRKKKSVLKCTSLEDLRKFKWSKLMKEWAREAPLLYKVLRAIAMPPQFAKRKMQSLRPIIGTAGAMLLKARNAQMSAVQYLVGLSLFLGQKHHINPTKQCTGYLKCTSRLMEQ